MRECWSYSPKHRPSFFSILQDFEADMSDKFRETSFYFNQDVGEAASVSDDNEADATDDLETDRLNQPPNESSAPGCSGGNTSLSSTPKFTTDRSSSILRMNGSRDCAPENSRQTEIADSSSEKPPAASQSALTDRLLASSSSDADNIRLSDVTAGSSSIASWNSGGGGPSSDVPTTIDVDADAARRKSALTNGHIPYSFVTTARC